jgi:hypothetical protein
VGNGKVTITAHDQPECTIPLADFVEFAQLYLDAENAEIDDDDFEEPSGFVPGGG